MKLLNYENYQVVPSEEAFLIKPIRDIYNKDKSEDKEFFMQQMSYMFHFCDPRSSYADIFDDEERHRQIILQEGLPEDFKPSKQLVEAMEVYKKVTTTTSLKLLESMRRAVAKIGEFLENVNLYDTDDKGKPKYSVSTITAATDKIPLLAKKLIETERIVASEIEEGGKMRGGEERAHAFEGGFNG